MPEKRNLRKNRIYASTSRVVPYLLPDEVQRLAEAARLGTNGERDSLFILVLYQTGLRISEGLSLTPAMIDCFEGKPVLHIIGKGNKPRTVSCPMNLAGKLRIYASERGLDPHCRFFPFTRIRGWQIIKDAARSAAFTKRIFPHSL